MRLTREFAEQETETILARTLESRIKALEKELRFTIWLRFTLWIGTPTEDELREYLTRRGRAPDPFPDPPRRSSLLDELNRRTLVKMWAVGSALVANHVRWLPQVPRVASPGHSQTMLSCTFSRILQICRYTFAVYQDAK
jgi:hypothetical protein